MAISTTNQEYISARKRADETLHRFFESHHQMARGHGQSHGHGAGTAVNASAHTSAMGPYASVGTSRGSHRNRSSADIARTRSNDDYDQHSNSLDSFSFVSPTLCSISNEFFTQPNSLPAAAIAETSQMMLEDEQRKFHASVLTHSPAPSYTIQSLSPSPSRMNYNNHRNHNSPPRSTSPSFAEIVNQHLRSIEEEYGIPAMRASTNPFQMGIRRYPLPSKLTKRVRKNKDIEETIIQLTNIVFQSQSENNTVNGNTTEKQLTPKEQFQKLGSALPKKVCQHPFKRNDIVWVCRTCQADETCVLCHACFNASDHTNHDVAFYHAQAGGCCDCGDPDAWDPKGFCPLHGKDCGGLEVLGAELEWRVKGVVDYCIDFLEICSEGVQRGYNRANVGEDWAKRDGKRKFGRSMSDGDVEIGASADSEISRIGDVGEDEEDQEMFATDNSNGRGNYHRSNTAPEEHTIIPNSDETNIEAMDTDTNPEMSEHGMEWDQGIEGGSSVSQLSPFPDSSDASAARTPGEDECKFDAAAASTSKSRLNTSGSSLSLQDQDDDTGQKEDGHESKTPDSKCASTEKFDPEAASTSKSQLRARKYAIPENMTPAHHLGLLGSQEQGLFLLLHADDVHQLLNITTALRSLYYSHPNKSERITENTSHKIAHLFQPNFDIGDLIIWGTHELMEELGPVLSSCWKDGDATACTRFGALMIEKAKILTKIGLVVSIKTREELCREIRCAAVLEFLNMMAESCDPLCRIVSVGLGAKEDDDKDAEMEKEETSGSHLISMLRNDLKLPRKLSKSWHDLLLTLLAVPNFKAALANAYVDTYSAVTSEYAQGIGIFDKSSYTLSVQFLNRVTYVEDLVKQRDLLGCLVRSLFATLSVARKKNSNIIDGSTAQISVSNRSAAWTINMIHDVIDDYLNPLGPRTTSPAWGLRRDERKEPVHSTPSRLNPILDPLHPVLSHRRYGPCVSDLKCVLNVPGVARLFSSIPKHKLSESPIQKPCLLDAWIHTLSLMQNMDGQRWRREEEGHVDQEPRDWVGAFNAGIAIGSLYERILSWEEDDDNIKNNLYRAFNKSQNFLSAVELTKYVLINGIDSWQNSESLSFIPTTNGSIPEYNSPTCLPMSTIAADNNVPTAMKALSVAQSQIWSFHLPLHRFVASCLREVSRRPYQRADEKPGGMDELLSSLRESEDARKLYRIYSGLIEYPAVILARNSQIRSELWLRNGKSMFDQVLNYGEPHFCKGLRDADLALIQFAFIGLLGIKQADLDSTANGDNKKHIAFSPAHLLNLLIHRFGVFEFAGFSNAVKKYEDRYWDEIKEGFYPPEKQMDSETKTLPWSYSPTDDSCRHKSMLEELLYTLIIFITELYGPPPLDAEDDKRQAKARLRREIVHRLASGPKAHSELAEVHHVLPMRDNMILSEEGKCVNPDDATGAALEAALVDIADCKTSKGKSDKWELQRWAWNEYDPAFFHLSLRQHQNASEFRPNGTDSKDRSITPMPYAPFPPAAHKNFLRIRRDITSDASLISMLYRALHIHCRDSSDGDDFLGKLDTRKREAYTSQALSETILGRVIHLLTLGAYAWEDSSANGDCMGNAGREVGSVFHDLKETPTQENWVKKVLLGKPAAIMSSDAYIKEQNTLQLLQKLVVSGGSDYFKVQDRSIRCGAAWLCEYASRHSAEAKSLLGTDTNTKQSMLDSLEADKKRRSKEAKERAMRNFKKKIADFAKTMDDSDGANDGSKSPYANMPPPRSPGVGSANGYNTLTPKTGDTQVSYAENLRGIPGIPTLLNTADDGVTCTKQKPRLFKERPRCIICAEDGVISQNIDSAESNEEQSLAKPKKKILALCGYIQPSTVARGCGGSRARFSDRNQNDLVGTHISLCGHAIHVTCCESHLKDSGQDRYFDGKRADFRCPMCRGLSNCLIPFLDVGRGWAFTDSDKETTGLNNKTLHNFLDKSKWWATRNDSLFMWNGRCSFVPSATSSDAVKYFGKKDLCRAWSTVLWTPPHENGVAQSHSSTGVAVSWRRILDQISDISHKADTKRIGEDNIHLGEFRHYLIEKMVYNQEISSPTIAVDWPSCVLPSPTHEKRQALSREKLISKQLLLIQSLTYTCCAEILECTRLARDSNKTNLSSVLAKFGVSRFVCNGRFIIMPLPFDGDGTQLFDGQIGKLRYFALAVLVSTSPLAREVVHLCMDLPLQSNSLPFYDEGDTAKRADIVNPILFGNILTRVVAAMSAVCGHERTRSEALGAASSFMTNLVPNLGDIADETTVRDCLHFIQMGFIGRLLQVLLGTFQNELLSEDQTDMDWNKFEQNIGESVQEVLSSSTKDPISAWEKGCCSLLKTVFSDQSSLHMDESTNSSLPDRRRFFSNACDTARLCCQDYIYNAGIILQILLPKSSSIFQSMEGTKKESVDEIDALFRMFGVENLESLLDSPLVIEVIVHWYERARPAKKLTGRDLLLDCPRVFRVHDWPTLHPSGSLLTEKKDIPIGHLPLLQGNVLIPHVFDNTSRRIESLPTSYTDLYATLSLMMPDCDSIAVCLVCGEVLNAGGKGECTKHSQICGGGCGLYFLLQECICLAIHKDTAVYLTSPYVDSHGETPQYRGRPLNMDKSRYDFLHELWSGHQLRAHVIAERSRIPRHRMIASHYY